MIQSSTVIVCQWKQICLFLWWPKSVDEQIAFLFLFIPYLENRRSAFINFACVWTSAPMLNTLNTSKRPLFRHLFSYLCHIKVSWISTIKWKKRFFTKLSYSHRSYSFILVLCSYFFIARKYHELQTERNVYSVLIMTVGQWLRLPNKSIVLE